MSVAGKPAQVAANVDGTDDPVVVGAGTVEDGNALDVLGVDDVGGADDVGRPEDVGGAEDVGRPEDVGGPDDVESTDDVATGSVEIVLSGG